MKVYLKPVITFAITLTDILANSPGTDFILEDEGIWE